jgi:hypothetical protein
VSLNYEDRMFQEQRIQSCGCRQNVEEQLQFSYSLFSQQNAFTTRGRTSHSHILIIGGIRRLAARLEDLAGNTTIRWSLTER